MSHSDPSPCTDQAGRAAPPATVSRKRRGLRGVSAFTVSALIAALAPSLALAPAQAASAAESCSVDQGSASSSVNAALTASSVTASYTAPWNRIGAIRDGQKVFFQAANDQVWGTYTSANRPAQQWLQYDWNDKRTLTGASVSFARDSDTDPAGDGLAVPRAWKLQAWEGTAWADIAVTGGFPRAQDATNTVTFAAPVETTKLRAVLDASTNGTTFAAMAVSEFEVMGMSGPTDGMEWLTSSSFNVGISRSTGGIYHLGNASDAPFCTNYVANPTVRPEFDVNDSRWLGDIGMRVNGTPRVTSLSDDTRSVTKDGNSITVDYTGDAAHPNGIRGFGLEETYSLTGAEKDVLDWSIRLDNTSSAPLELEDLGIPLLMNAWWDGGNQKGIYEQNVGRHSFVAQDGSYVVWQRPNGVGPFLVMVPEDGTKLEFKDKARPGEGPFAEKDPSWEGLVEYYVHSEHVGPFRSDAEKAAQFLPASSATIAPGANKSYGFSFRWADDYADMRDVLYEAGVVDVVSLPGMTIPQDTTATLAVRARDGIDAVVGGGGVGTDGDDAVITPSGTRNGYTLYDIAFPTLGENFVTVEYGDGKTSVLQYYSIEPVEKLIQANSDFIVTNQQAKDKAKGYDGAFLQWDMLSKQIITRDSFASAAAAGIGEFQLRWMTGGSDDVGLSPAAFVAEKNALSNPDATEIESLDYYIDNFLLGYLQNQFRNGERTWNVYHWYDGGDGDRPATGRDDGSSPGVGDGLATWRVMNSPHIWNTYFSMYKIAKQYPGLTQRPAAEYLDMSYRTMEAYFEHDDARFFLPDSSRDLASMGELSYPLVEAALRSEGRAADADILQKHYREKYEIFASKEYPFASEMSVDTTAFEANYTLGKMYGDDALVKKVTLASLASRGNQPLWYFYGSDNRHMGESWWNLGYETQLGAWQQQDYAKNYTPEDDGIDSDELMRSTYGAYLAGWANINSGQISSDPDNYGAASWIYSSEKGSSDYFFVPKIDGWWAWSGESALGFWGALQTAAVNVVNDDILGVYGYGGDVDVTDSQYSIVPKDGVRQRLNLFTENKFGIELQNAKYTEAVVDKGLGSVTLQLEAAALGAVSPAVTMTNLPAGSYQVFVDDRLVQTVSAADLAAGVFLPSPGESAHELRVTRAPLDSTAPVSSVETDPASGTVASGQTITARFSATDAGSGVARTEYSTDAGSTWVGSTAEGVSFRDVGTYLLQYRSVDNAGNVEVAKSVTLAVTPPPAVGAMATITAADPPSADGWYRQNVLVRLDPARAGQKVQYQVNGGTWRTYSTPLTVSTTGTTTIAHRLLASNVVVVGSLGSTVVKLDKGLPIVSATRSPAAGAGTPLNPISLTFAAADTVSGIERVEYRINDGAWAAAGSGPLVLGSVGDYVVSYRSIDKAGNASTLKSASVTITANLTKVVKTGVRTAKPGDAVTLSIAGFARWSDVSLSVGGVVVATVMTDQNGSARVTVRVPSSVADGPAAVTAVGADQSLTAGTTITIRR